MDNSAIGYAFWQVTGKPVEGVNQQRNLGNGDVGIVAELIDCGSGSVFLTSPTFPALASADAWVERQLTLRAVGLAA